MAINNVFGAVGLTGGANGSLDSINGNLLKEGDIGYVISNSILYNYILNVNNKMEDSPLVIAPDVNGTNKRWELISINRTAGDLTIPDGNSLITQTANISAANIDVLYPDIIKPNNETLIKSSDNTSVAKISTSYFTLIKAHADNTDLVQNLNAEYINGNSISELVKESNLPSNSTDLTNGVSSQTISIGSILSNTTYNIISSIENVTDPSPTFYNHIITNKTTTSFTVTFSSEIDSINYKLNWIIKL